MCPLLFCSLTSKPKAAGLGPAASPAKLNSTPTKQTQRRGHATGDKGIRFKIRRIMFVRWAVTAKEEEPKLEFAQDWRAQPVASVFLEVSWEFQIGIACVTPTCSARSPWDASATCLHCGWQLWCPAGGLDGQTHRQHVSASLFGNLRLPSQGEENFG